MHCIGNKQQEMENWVSLSLLELLTKLNVGLCYYDKEGLEIKCKANENSNADVNINASVLQYESNAM